MLVPVLAVGAAAVWWLVVRPPSPHFTWKEAGSPPVKYRGNARLMALQVLEPIRSKIGPFSPTSWWRSGKHNTEIGGVADSLHLQALAVDIGAVGGLSVAQVAAIVKSIEFAVPVDIVYGTDDHKDHVHIEIDE